MTADRDGIPSGERRTTEAGPLQSFRSPPFYCPGPRRAVGFGHTNMEQRMGIAEEKRLHLTLENDRPLLVVDLEDRVVGVQMHPGDEEADRDRHG